MVLFPEPAYERQYMNSVRSGVHTATMKPQHPNSSALERGERFTVEKPRSSRRCAGPPKFVHLDRPIRVFEPTKDIVDITAPWSSIELYNH